MGPALFDAGVSQMRDFDQRFYGKNKTLTMSDRDVIYVTRSTVPMLVRNGIKGLTIGSNGANYPPQVPKLHLWRDPATDTEVVVAYHPYGYGGYGKSTCAGPGQCGDCAEAPNGVALCTEFRTDNTGPPTSTDEIIASLDAVRAEYPKASVFASTFDAFVEDVLPVKDQLPVVTSEVGDTWMYGAPSDPLKMAQNRLIQRAWEDCLAKERAAGGHGGGGESSCEWENSAAIRNMTRFLMKAPEHTWGTPGISGWGSGDDYDKANFTAHLNNDAYHAAASSWAEQRIFNYLAAQALVEGNHPLADVVVAELAELSSVTPVDVSGMTFHPFAAGSKGVTVPIGAAQVTFDATGAISSLQFDDLTEWASAEQPLAAFAYQTLNDSDWKPFTYDYINGHAMSGGFCKPGSNNYTESKQWRPSLQGVYTRGNTAVAKMTMDPIAASKYGAPRELYLKVVQSAAQAVSSLTRSTNAPARRLMGKTGRGHGSANDAGEAGACTLASTPAGACASRPGCHWCSPLYAPEFCTPTSQACPQSGKKKLAAPGDVVLVATAEKGGACTLAGWPVLACTSRPGCHWCSPLYAPEFCTPTSQACPQSAPAPSRDGEAGKAGVASFGLDLELTWIGKTPTMVGESSMLTFPPAPALASAEAWSLDKMGGLVDPEDVIDGGNQFNHGTWRGGAQARTAAGETFTVSSLDAPNMCPQTPLFPHGNPLPAGSDGLKQLKQGSVFGVGVNLHNNLWNTNYPLYYPFFDPAYCTSPTTCKDANARFRFEVTVAMKAAAR